MKSRGYMKALLTIVVSMAVSPTLCSMAETPAPPNLLFIMTDQQRWDTMSIAGNSLLITPNIDRIGKEGAFFENFYSTRAICVPARASILTGCSPHNTGIYGNGDYEKVVSQTTFDRILHAQGYYTRYFGKWHTPDNLLYHEDGTTPVYDNPDIGNNDHNVTLVKMQDGQIWGYNNTFREFLDGTCLYGLNTTNVERSTIEDPANNRYVSTRYQGLYEALPSDEHLMPESQEFGRILVSDEYSITAFQGKQTMKALNEAAELNQPFAITVSIGPPHDPMIVPNPWFSHFPAGDMPVSPSINDPYINQPYDNVDEPYNNPSVIRDMTQCYYAMIEEVDFWVGKVLDELDELELADNTLVIFTSDHGEMLGDHGQHSKSILWEGATHVPGLFRFPRKTAEGVSEIPSNTVVKTPAATIDLFPTILDYLDIPYDPAAENTIDGYSVRSLIDGTAGEGAHPDYCVAEGRLLNKTLSRVINKPMYAVRTESWKLIVAEDPTSTAIDALYDMDADPDEMNNLIGSAAGQIQYRDVAEAMQTRLVHYLNRLGSAEATNVEARAVVPVTPKEDGELNWASDAAVANAELALVEMANKGNTEAFTIDGRSCRAKADSATDMFFSFNTDESLFYQTPGAPVAIECEYFVSENPTRVWLRYDSVNGSTIHPVKIEDRDVGQWKTARWYINDAFFGDRLESGADFYIRIPPETDGYISRVKVVLPESADWPPFRVDGNTVQWLEDTDALGWKLYEIDELNTLNSWNQVSGGIVAINGNKVYTIPETARKSFYKMQK